MTMGRRLGNLISLCSADGVSPVVSTTRRPPLYGLVDLRSRAGECGKGIPVVFKSRSLDARMIARGASVLYPWAMAMVGRGRLVDGCEGARGEGGVVVCVGFVTASSGSPHYHLYQSSPGLVLETSWDPDGGIAPANMTISRHDNQSLRVCGWMMFWGKVGRDKDEKGGDDSGRLMGSRGHEQVSSSSLWARRWGGLV